MDHSAPRRSSDTSSVASSRLLWFQQLGSANWDEDKVVLLPALVSVQWWKRCLRASLVAAPGALRFLPAFVSSGLVYS